MASPPVIPADIRAAFPRESRGKDDAELEVWLEIEQAAIRSHFGIVRVDAEATASLRRAMLAAWPSFVQQVRQVASEQAGKDSYSVTFNRAAGGTDFVFPSFVGTILAEFSELEAPSVTQLVR